LLWFTRGFSTAIFNLSTIFTRSAQKFCLQLFHDTAAMNLHGIFGISNLSCNLFIDHAGDRPRAHLALSCRQRFEAYAAVLVRNFCFSSASGTWRCSEPHLAGARDPLQCEPNRIQQTLVADSSVRNSRAPAFMACVVTGNRRIDSVHLALSLALA
jgi:hypothetical protein